MDKNYEITIKFINIKDNKILSNKLNNELPTIHIKEEFYNLENIKYYLSLYLNITIDNIRQIKDNYFYFDVNENILDYNYSDVEVINDIKLMEILNNI